LSTSDYKKYFSEHHNGPFRKVTLLTRPIKPLLDINGSDASLKDLQDRMFASERGQNKVLTLFDKSSQEKAVLINSAAYHLGRPICLISCADFVHHYIGETEKNITRLMAKAENKKWLLFFDEADALFSAYSSDDENEKSLLTIRFDYLLKQMSSHSGLLIVSIDTHTCLDKLAYLTDRLEPISSVFPRR
jgi:SpoVK/Ycf46/Vps4 family AAA+-type ATPase